MVIRFPCFNDLQSAAFLRRPNRFVVHCTAGDRDIKAFLPNSGRLQELLVPGAPLLLQSCPATPSGIRFRVAGVKNGDETIMLDTHLTNDTARYLLEHGMIKGLEDANVVRAEVKHGNSRFDFLMERKGRLFFLEVKSCTLIAGSLAMFPDAPTDRGSRHIRELASCRISPERGAVLFLIHSGKARQFLPDYHTDPEFARTLYDRRGKVDIFPAALSWNEDMSLSKEIRICNIPWNIVEKENADRGCYLMILRIEKQKQIRTGSLGILTFDKGFYIYAGSARKNLQARIDRHKRLTKTLFWHADYLRAHAKVHAILPVRSSEDLECLLAESVGKITDAEIKGFGCSDCDCASHLFYKQDDPLLSLSFQELILNFRMKRLVKG